MGRHLTRAGKVGRPEDLIGVGCPSRCVRREQVVHSITLDYSWCFERRTTELGYRIRDVVKVCVELLWRFRAQSDFHYEDLKRRTVILKF